MTNSSLSVQRYLILMMWIGPREEHKMSNNIDTFSLKVDGIKSVCATGEAWANTQIKQRNIPVLACEGPCVRGDIARRVANLIIKEQPFSRACYAEVALVPHSSMAQWVKEADHVVMLDGCFLMCMGRVLNNLVDKEKIIHLDAMAFYDKYTEIFFMEDVPESERNDTARQVTAQVMPRLRERLEKDRNPSD
jgi:uncharacterized metal-binding protein